MKTINFVESFTLNPFTKQLLTFTIILTFITPSYSDWGFFAHKKIVENAIYILPKELFPFYKQHKSYLVQQTIIPDARRMLVTTEETKHFINLEYYSELDSSWTNWYELNELYPIDSLREWGVGPWHISLMKENLKNAFYEKNQHRILKISSEMAHYISDIMVPLHTTKNYNGQLTNQKGVHQLWEKNIVEDFYKDYNLFTDKAKYIKQAQQHIWTEVLQSYKLSKEVLSSEKEVSATYNNEKYQWVSTEKSSQNSYSQKFLEEFYNEQHDTVELQLKKSIFYTASLWLSAWIEAGQPDLSSLENMDTPLPTKRTLMMGPKILRENWQ